MSLPANNSPWPPKAMQGHLDEMALHAAWYGSDVEALANLYYRTAWNPFASNALEAGAIARQRRSLVHVPVAADIAETSAAHLFSEHPKISVPGVHDEGAPAILIQTQERLDEILADTNAYGVLLQAAEQAAALGGIYIKVNWDKDLAPHPILNIAQADKAIPEFSYGILTGVNFWTELDDTGSTSWRLVERHEPGHILTALYKGSSDNIGGRVALTARAETADLRDDVPTQLEGLAVRYIPNRLPNRKHRGSNIGRSDYSGLTGLMESLDDTYTSLLRDIRLGRGRLLVPEQYVQNVQGKIYMDLEQEVFVPLRGLLPDEHGMQITIQQFAIRAQEHEQAAKMFLERVVTHAGYSPQSFGIGIEGRAESGTALKIRERKSLLTAAAKSEYWRPAIADLCEILLLVDRIHLNTTGTEPARPDVEIQDSITPDIAELATSVDMVNRAQAASVDTRVRMLHPDWSDERVAQEVETIMQEQGLTLPDPMQLGELE